MTDLSDTHTRPLWRDRRFATYWSRQAVSQLGDRVSELALPLIAVTALHASAAKVGVLTAAVWAPNLLSLVVGAWVDHQRRKGRLNVSEQRQPLRGHALSPASQDAPPAPAPRGKVLRPADRR